MILISPLNFSSYSIFLYIIELIFKILINLIVDIIIIIKRYIRYSRKLITKLVIINIL